MAKKKNKEPQYLPSPMNNQMINYKVYYMSWAEKIFFALVTFAIGGFVGWVFYGGLFTSDGEATFATHVSNAVVFVIVGAITMKVAFPAIRNMLKKRRSNALRVQFRDMLESLVASLGSGNTVSDSFRNALSDLLNQYSETQYIVVELEEIINGMNNGQTLETMLTDFGNRSDNTDIQNFSNVISNCFRVGGDFKNAVRKTRDIISEKMSIEEEIETKVSSNKLQHNAMCVMPIILVAALKATNSSFAQNLSSFLGVLVTTVAIGIFVGSYFWGRKIIDIG